MGRVASAKLARNPCNVGTLGVAHYSGPIFSIRNSRTTILVQKSEVWPNDIFPSILFFVKACSDLVL